MNQHIKEGQAHEQTALYIAGVGLTCAVGYHLRAASCALRAGMDHFQESLFSDLTGNPLVVAQLPIDDLWGAPRLAEIARMALSDCAASMPFDPASTALLLLASEYGRPHSEPERYQEVWQAVQAQFATPFHPASRILAQGRAGIGDALLRAGQMLLPEDDANAVPHGIARVLLLCVDSYLNAATIEHYLQQRRLLTRDNNIGFIPGEAAAAILLELDDGKSAGLHITGIGIAQEAAQPDNDIPNRAMGLSQAMRAACAMAEIAPGELDFRLSDQNGEQYFSREAANAITRLMMEDSKQLPVHTIAYCVGETGAAAGGIMLAYLSQVMPRKDGPGDTALVHLANADGRRCALVLENFA